MSKTNKKINWRVNVLSYNESSQFCQMTWRIPCAFRWLPQGETFQYECHAGWHGQGWKGSLGLPTAPPDAHLIEEQREKRYRETGSYNTKKTAYWVSWVGPHLKIFASWFRLRAAPPFRCPSHASKNKNQRKKPPKRRNCSQSTLSYDVWTSLCSILT